jgi:hypothetical protein
MKIIPCMQMIPDRDDISISLANGGEKTPGSLTYN